MNKIAVFTALVACCGLSVPVRADTISLTPQIQKRKQSCFVDQFQGYVARFDGKRFEVQVVLERCSGNRKVSLGCNPYTAPKNLAASVLAKRVNLPDSELLRYEFDEEEIAGLNFNSIVGELCPVGGLEPRPGRDLPPAVHVNPTQHFGSTVLTAKDAYALGIHGKLVGAEWSAPAMKTVREGDTISFKPVKVRGNLPATPVGVGDRVAVGGEVHSSASFGYYLVAGNVEAESPDGFTMRVSKIVQTSERSTPWRDIAFVEVVDAAKVRLQAHVATGRVLSWFGHLRGIPPVPLELRIIRQNNGARLVETTVKSPLGNDRTIEILGLIRGAAAGGP